MFPLIGKTATWERQYQPKTIPKPTKYLTKFIFFLKILRNSEKMRTFAAEMAERAAIEHFDYLHLLAQVKQRVRLAQQRAIYSANDDRFLPSKILSVI
jgi:hypothetical protein